MVDYQMTVSHGKRYQTCLFGDSISAQLGDSLGENTFNFSLPGMSTVSLLEQIQQLIGRKVKCQTAIVAIGTNDAWYTISDDQFSQNLSQVIEHLRSHGTQQTILIPAFYSTLAASKNPAIAGSIERVDQINGLLNQVAISQQVPVQTAAIQPLFNGKELKSNLTIDGVHLNAAGVKIYRAALMEIMSRQLSEDRAR
jgi:lysophospholipase L1-like esterase